MLGFFVLKTYTFIGCTFLDKVSTEDEVKKGFLDYSNALSATVGMNHSEYEGYCDDNSYEERADFVTAFNESEFSNQTEVYEDYSNEEVNYWLSLGQSDEGQFVILLQLEKKDLYND